MHDDDDDDDAEYEDDVMVMMMIAIKCNSVYMADKGDNEYY